MKEPSRGLKATAWVLAVVGLAIVVLGVVESVREPGVDWVSIFIGGSIALNMASITRPPGRGRGALLVGALALAAAALVVVFL